MKANSANAIKTIAGLTIGALATFILVSAANAKSHVAERNIDSSGDNTPRGGSRPQQDRHAA
jgi:hypothetical protein